MSPNLCVAIVIPVYNEIGVVGQSHAQICAIVAEDAQLGPFKKWNSGLFYRILNIILGTRVLPGAADFRTLSRCAVDTLKAMPEYHHFLRGMVSWIGFKTAILPYHQGARVGGASKYSLGKMFRLAMDTIFSFSLAPLYVGLSLGGVLLLLALAEMIYMLSFWVTDAHPSSCQVGVP